MPGHSAQAYTRLQVARSSDMLSRPNGAQSRRRYDAFFTNHDCGSGHGPGAPRANDGLVGVGAMAQPSNRRDTAHRRWQARLVGTGAAHAGWQTATGRAVATQPWDGWRHRAEFEARRSAVPTLG